MAALGYALLTRGIYKPGSFSSSHTTLPRKMTFHDEICHVRIHRAVGPCRHDGYALLVEGVGIRPETFTEESMEDVSGYVRVYLLKDRVHS